jgi:large subunit ribosomal protein L15
MKIENLPGDPGRKQKPKRVGRGESSGWGRQSGRGNKGYYSRAGSGRRLGDEGGQMPLHRRLPKRGFTALDHRTYHIVNVGQLDRFEANAEVNPKALLAAGLIRRNAVPIKVLADGAVTKPLRVSAHAFSEAAREKITQAGGACETIA